jgi:methionyl-tRNA synthetase
MQLQRPSRSTRSANGSPRTKTARTGLGDWDISRDAPYFGIEIPDAPGKYFYVWLDAPIGYLASLKNYFAARPRTTKYGEHRSFEEFMADPAVEQIHFIGKDITYFHTLFWPAMLQFSGRKTPRPVYVHGFMTVNSGEKMSKSRGTGLDPLKYLELGMNPEWLRYYIAPSSTQRVEDVDFNPDDFVARVNSRPGGQVHQHRQPRGGFSEQALRRPAHAPPLGDEGRIAAGPRCAPVPAPTSPSCTKSANTARRCARSCCWPTRSTSTSTRTSPGSWPSKRARTRALHEVCTVCIEAFRLLTIYLKPVLPALARPRSRPS